MIFQRDDEDVDAKIIAQLAPSGMISFRPESIDRVWTNPLSETVWCEIIHSRIKCHSYHKETSVKSSTRRKISA